MRCFWITVLMPIFAATAAALDYDYLVEGGEATITGYNGAGGDVVIPETIDGYSIAAIGDEAFYSCDGLSSISIPDSVTNIGDNAFSFCDGLTSISIPNSVTTIGYRTFSYCDGLISITIPDSVTTIGENAFTSCDSLTSIQFSGNAPACPLSAFYNISPAIFYRYGTTGWRATLAGRRTAIWPEISNTKASPSDIAFDIIASEDQKLIIECCTNLNSGTWFPAATNMVPAGERLEFSDQDHTLYPNRYYRVVAPLD